MADKNQKEKHRCPPEPWAQPNTLMTPSWTGEDVKVAQSKWLAHLRRVQRLVPMPRTTRQ